MTSQWRGSNAHKRTAKPQHLGEESSERPVSGEAATVMPGLRQEESRLCRVSSENNVSLGPFCPLERGFLFIFKVLLRERGVKNCRHLFFPFCFSF